MLAAASLVCLGKTCHFFLKEHFNPCIFQELLSLFCLFVISLLPGNLKPFAFHSNLKAIFNYVAS